MTTNGNDPISLGYTNDPNSAKNLGLTKRESIAIESLTGFDNLPDHLKESICGEDAPSFEVEELWGIKERRPMYGEPYVQWLLKGRSKFAVMQADALIAALNAKEVTGE